MGGQSCRGAPGTNDNVDLVVDVNEKDEKGEPPRSSGIANICFRPIETDDICFGPLQGPIQSPVLFKPAGDIPDHFDVESDAMTTSYTQEALKYSPTHAPFLFSERKRRHSFCCLSRSTAKKDTLPLIHDLLRNLDLKYDMWVMPVLTLMKLEKMEPHQVLITKGMILRWRPVMQGRIIFVSHQWLGFAEPDPACAHLRALQRVLRRLMQGDITEVTLDWKRKMLGVAGLTVKADAWVAALPHMYVWLDYFSMPQVSVAVPEETVSTGARERFQDQSALAASLSVSYAIKIAETRGRSPGSPALPVTCTNLASHDSVKPQHTDLKHSSTDCSDHRYSFDENALDLQDAVASIPAYVALSSLLLVLAPVCKHHETSRAADYSTWRKRGWCRMELAAACLAPHDLPMMLVTGSEQVPYFIYATDAICLPPGEGMFSCCAMNHVIGNTTIPCDKQRVLPVMEALISCKLDQLAKDGLDKDRCMYASFRNVFLRGLPVIDLGKPDSVASLNELLRFDSQIDLVSNPSKGNRLLLQLAIQFDAIQVISELLDTCTCDLNATGFPLPPLGLPAWPPLSLAMGFAGPDTVRQLLDRRADPLVKIKEGFGLKGTVPFKTAVFRGREDNIRAWMQYFPNYSVNVDDRSSFFGFHLMHAAVVAPGAEASMVRVLLDVRADLMARSKLGGTPLHIATQAPDACEDVINELLRNKADVNSVLIPQTRLIRRLAWLCRKTVKVGDRDSLKVTLATSVGSTPLHLAAKSGQSVVIEALLKARANTRSRNAMGHTPLDVAAWMFKEVPQPILELLR